jgi:hypothetical protein
MKQLTKELLEKLKACELGIEYAEKNNLIDKPIKEVLKHLESDNKKSWFNWFIFNYCKDIENDKNLANKLNDDCWIYCYCRYVENDKKLANRLTNDHYINEYKKL